MIVLMKFLLSYANRYFVIKSDLGGSGSKNAAAIFVERSPT